MKISKDFILYNKINDLEKYTRKYIVPEIPKIHRDLRIHLLDEIYYLKKYLFGAEFNRGNIRNKNINDMIITISMINSNLDNIIYNCPKVKPRVIKSVGLLTDIKNMTYAWKSNIDETTK